MPEGQKSATIYFVRHGECKANVEDMNLSPEKDQITDKGKLQASLLGKHLQDVIFTKAYTSNYPRALDTAEEIICNLKTPTPELILDSRIREAEMGEFENRPMKHVFDAMFKAAREKGTQMLDFAIPGGEPMESLNARLNSFLEDLIKLTQEGDQPQTILVVSHGVAIMRMMFKLRFWSKDPSRGLTLNGFSTDKLKLPMKNTGYNLLTVTRNSGSNGEDSTIIDMVQLQEVGHLDPIKPKVAVPPSKEYQEIVKNWLEVTDQQCATV